jgi:glycosyltransferase involved in cell wall biosynthesis
MQRTAVAVAEPAAQRRERALPGALPLAQGKRIVLVQTQAEGAGAQEVSRILGRGLCALGYDVHTVFFFRRTAAFDDQPNTFFCALQRPSGVAGVVTMFMRLVRHLRELQPDAVLCFQHYGIIVGTAAARLAGVRAVIANRTSAKSVIPPAARWLDAVFGFTRLVRATVVNSRSVEREYDRYPVRYRARVVRIDHGFEAKTSRLDRDEARKSFALPSNVPLLGCVARLHPAKNLGAAIRILVGCDWHLAIAGQGAARAELTALATSLGVESRVHFVGELRPDRIGSFLRALDVFVFPSVAETFGLAPVEAAQAGVPVVANDLEVLRETLSADGNPCALFVDAGDSKAFAAAVERLLGDADLRALLTARGAALSRRYSLDTMVQRYADLIEATVARESVQP